MQLSCRRSTKPRASLEISGKASKLLREGQEEIVSCSEVLAHFNLGAQVNVFDVQKYCIFVCLWLCLAGPALLLLS